MSTPEETAAQLKLASVGFDHLFANRIDEARKVFSTSDSPFHSMGLGVCAFLEAALGMETQLMAEATQSLTLSEAGAKKQLKSLKSSKSSGRYPAGTEWELLHADAVILLGLVNALSESYMGYLQCLYAMNTAHGKFSKLYKTVFPTGLSTYSTPAQTPAPSRKPSLPSLSNDSTTTLPAPTPAQPSSLAPPVASSASSVSSTKSTPAPTKSFFGRWGGSSSSLSSPAPVPSPGRMEEGAASVEEGSVEELVVSGTAFGYGLFNLVFSLLPAKVKGVVGFFGYQHDRKLALQALAVSAQRSDVHGVFAGLTLMTYHGVVLLMAGYQADEAHIIKQYRAIVDKISSRYPTGSLWILNRAKIIRMLGDPSGAIDVLRDGLGPHRPKTFVQADALLLFELAWTLLSQRRYEESAETFIKMTEMNSWSHATYYFIAAGCYVSLKNYKKAQELFDAIPGLLDKKKLGGKDLPTEVLIRKKLTFYRKKQVRKGGKEECFAECSGISPAEELAIFWNTHARIPKSTAEEHVRAWTSLSPPVSVATSYASPTASSLPSSGPEVNIDTADELAVRSLLLGIVHRTLGDFASSRAFLLEARKLKTDINTWVAGVAMFELAVLDLKELDGAESSKSSDKEEWRKCLKGVNAKLDEALSLSGKEIDLSSRLDSRIVMLRDEVAVKKEMVGI